MTDEALAQWLRDTRRRAARLKLLFLQLGCLSEEARRLLTTEFGVVTVNAYLAGDRREDRALVVIDGVENLIKPVGRTTMGALRERVFADLDSGNELVLLSRAPRAAFPEVPGSSLLDDATFAHGYRDGTIDRKSEHYPLELALRELGTAVCSSLDRVLFECLMSGDRALQMLTSREVEALDGSGIISLSDPGESWLDTASVNLLKRALAEVLASEVAPQDQLAQVTEGLWEIERRIRRTVRQRAIAAWGATWLTQCLHGDLQAKVLGRATETAYLGANSVKLLRDPLEWLSLGELLELKSRSEIGELGVPNAVWRQFGAEIMPIRHRVAHMRNLHPGDSVTVLKWRRVLELKLQN